MSDLAAIRSKRIVHAGEGSTTGDDGNNESARQAAEQQEAAKNSILSQILEQNAMVRLSNFAAAKPEKAKMVENLIVQMASRGQIAGRLSDEGLKQLLDRFSEQTQTKSSINVKFDRRRAAIDSDSD